jgi:hypothetical protein
MLGPVDAQEEQPPVSGGPPVQVRLAGLLVGLQALLALGFVVALAVRASSSVLPLGAVVGEAGFFLVVGAALAAVAGGLLTGRRWARTPAMVTQLLLLPVVYTLLGTAGRLLVGIPAAAVVIACFLLLISEPSRVWSMGLDLPDPPR